MKTNGENITDERVVQKIIRSLNGDFDNVASAIEEAHDLTTLSIERFLGSLSAHDQRIRQRRKSSNSKHELQSESSILEKSLNPGVDSIGIRVPDNDFIRDIARGSGSALALTSANLSGHPSSVSVKDFENLWEHCAYIFDGGKLPMGRAGSTIVDLTIPGKYKIIRPGSAREDTVAILQRHYLLEEEDADST
ncbi:hypothetical protein KSS87_020609 [Heliosperma pusillum]|nr:hypothetical protein KSS87_020609 [Heliosperma pusillum]